EFGKTYHAYGDKRAEFKYLTIFVTGNKNQDHWQASSGKSDFFYLKGTINALLERLGISRYTETPIDNDLFSEGLTINLGKKQLVDFGLVKKSILKHFDISQDIMFANIHWDAVLEVITSHSIKFKSIPKYPEVRRDFALLIDENITFESIYKIAKQSEKRLLKAVNLFDVYQGKNLPEGKKSYAVSFTFQDENTTLTDKQIDNIMKTFQTQFED